MDTYLTMLYISLEQELALKAFFKSKGWSYTKADLSMVTDKVGPLCPAKTPGPDTSAPSPRSQRKAARAASSAQTQSKTPSKRGTASNAVSPTKVPITSHNEAEAEQGVDDLDFDIIENEDYDEDGDDDFADDLMDEEDNAEISGEKELTTKTTAMTRSGRKSKPTEKAAAAAMASKSSRGSLKSPTKKLIPKIVLKRERAETDATESTSTKRARNDDGTEKGDENIGEETCEEHYTTFLNNSDCDERLNTYDIEPESGAYGVSQKGESPASQEMSDLLEPIPTETFFTAAPAKTSYVCDLCGQSFARSDNLLNHKRYIHEGRVRKKKKREYLTCDQCGRKFLQLYSLREHVLYTHVEGAVLGYVCEHCGKSFSRKRQLEAHVNKVHLNVQPYVCETCHKGFVCQEYKDRHKAGHCTDSKSELAKYKCSKCEKAFISKDKLEVHLTAKHYGGAFKCMCGKNILYEASVPKHKNTCPVFLSYTLSSAFNVDSLQDEYSLIELPVSEVKAQGAEKNNDTDH